VEFGVLGERERQQVGDRGAERRDAQHADLTVAQRPERGVRGRQGILDTARCTLALERRTLPGETAEQIDREVAALLDRCRAADPEFAASHRTLLVREPFEIAIGESGAAPLAGLLELMTDERCAELRDRLEVGRRTRVLLIASEGITGACNAARSRAEKAS
jgi:hypothetical protein